MPPVRIPQRALILSDGGITSLLAAATAREWASIPPRKGSKPIQDAIVLPRPHLPPARQRAVELQAEFFGFELLVPILESIGVQTSAGEMRTRELLSATYAAARHACDTMIWPLQAARDHEPDLDLIAKAADRAVLVSRLVSIDGDQHAFPFIALETPYIDLQDTQIAELAVDLNVPLRLCWWNVAASDDSEAADERERWEQLMRLPATEDSLINR